MNPTFNKDHINRNNGTDATIEFSINIKHTAGEWRDIDINNDTQIIIKENNYQVTGGLKEYYNDKIRGTVDVLFATLEHDSFTHRLNQNELTSYQNYISIVQETEILNFSIIDKFITFIEARLNNISLEERENVTSVFAEVKSKWGIMKDMLPAVFYRKSDKTLKTQYKLEEVQNELNSPKSYPNSLLFDFVNLIDFSHADFINAVQAGTSGTKTTLRRRINSKVDTIINKYFHKYYTAEKVYLNVDIDSNVVSFSAQSSDGEALLLSERSNGLRWYLNTYIDATSHGLSSSNVIYLFDEPGISLHINAQKELLKLFKELSNKGNQVVYTTHSPYMLDVKSEGIYSIRAVSKNSAVYTSIYKTAYDAQLFPYSQKDTLSPIITAIGMNFNDTFGPSKEKLNIVIEGVSDYIYINTMAKLLNSSYEKYNFIPSVGASNCINICTILFGWGCPFIAVFDYDNEGVTKGGEVFRKKFLYEYGKQYCYVKQVTQHDVDNQNYKTTPCVIEDIVTDEELTKFIHWKGITNEMSKPLIAKIFCNAVEDGSYKVGRQCLDNFKIYLIILQRSINNI